MFLDAVETALADNPRKDHRHTLIHGQLMRKDQLTRCAELGVTISFFPAHIYYWGDKHYSESYWSEQDIGADVIRQMTMKCEDAEATSEEKSV